MSNDMKSIMREWRKLISEITPELIDDPETAPKIAQDLGGTAFAGAVYDVAEFAAYALDPTGVLAWEDAKLAYKEFVEELKRQEKQKDPDALENAKTNFINAISLGLAAFDVIPLATLAAKPITVLTKGRKFFRRLTRKLVKIDPKIAKSSDDIAKIFSKAEGKVKRKIGQKTLGQILKFDSIEKVFGAMFLTYLSSMALKVYEGKLEKDKWIKIYMLQAWVRILEEFFESEYVDPRRYEYVEPIRDVYRSWNDQKAIDAPDEEWDRLEEFLMSIPEYVPLYKNLQIKGVEDRESFIDFLEQEAEKKINREMKFYEEEDKSRE